MKVIVYSHPVLFYDTVVKQADHNCFKLSNLQIVLAYN